MPEGAASSISTSMKNSAVAPLATAGIMQTTALEHIDPAGWSSAMNVVLGGIALLNVTFVAAPGPLLRTLKKYKIGPPGCPFEKALLVTETSA